MERENYFALKKEENMVLCIHILLPVYNPLWIKLVYFLRERFMVYFFFFYPAQIILKLFHWCRDPGWLTPLPTSPAPHRNGLVQGSATCDVKMRLSSSMRKYIINNYIILFSKFIKKILYCKKEEVYFEGALPPLLTAPIKKTFQT